MSFFIGNCCLKVNYLLCGSNESSSEKRKKKLKIRQQTIVNNTSSNNQIIHRTQPTPINSYHHHYVNVTSAHHTIRPQNSINPSPQYENLNSHASSLNSFLHSAPSSSLLTNGILIKDIILRRTDPTERLGLTLCYGVTSNSTTNIYIQQIDQESLANEQSELRSGDQIIKINNHRVTSRDEAINLINGACRILLQIMRFEFPKTSNEDDSGIILPTNPDFDKSSNLFKSSLSLSLTALNHCHPMEISSEQLRSHRCLSLNNLHSSSSYSTKQFIRSQSLFGTTTDNEQLILKPLPSFHQSNERRDDSDSGLVCNRSRSNDSHTNPNQWTLKHFRRRCREQRLKEQYQTTDDEHMSELKQGRYWTRQQRKEHLVKAKQYRQRAKFFQQHSILPPPYSDSATDDFNLLNRIFLRENQMELTTKPFLAYKYEQQSSIERNRLKRMIQQHYDNRIKSQSNTTISISSTIDRPSMIIL